MADTRLIPPSLAFRFSIPCYRTQLDWTTGTGIDLPDVCCLPRLSQIDDQPTYADVRAGWSDEGLFFNVGVSGKKQSLWCRETQLTESDGFQVWIDTRDTHSVHRANRFCHWFLILPTGGGAKRDQPVATMLKINRAKEDPKTINQTKLRVHVKKSVGGYQLATMIPKRALTGWDPADHQRLGFCYAVVDREFGWQTLTAGPEFPISEDPSLWQTLELVE